VAVVITYALRNAILPVITIAGHQCLLDLLGANVLVEKVFSWPGRPPPTRAGVRMPALRGVCARCRGFVLLMATVVRDRQSAVDILYGIADPRVTIG